MSRAFIARLFIVGALVAGTACAKGDSTTGPDPADHALVQIDPKPIPFVIDNGPFYDKQAGWADMADAHPPELPSRERGRARVLAPSYSFPRPRILDDHIDPAPPSWLPASSRNPRRAGQT